MNLKLISNQLKKGSIKTIVERSNCSQTLVYEILRGEKKTSPKRNIIISTSLEVLEEQKKQDAQLSARFNEVVNYGTD
ncbi:hypothetical protein ACTS9E_14500 [Empedobacter brevis]